MKEPVIVYVNVPESGKRIPLFLFMELFIDSIIVPDRYAAETIFVRLEYLPT